MADSENNRVVELHKNESTGEWEESWTVYEIDGIPLDWPRDADRLPNGHTLITDSRNNRVVEITRNGSVVASYQVPDLPYEADRIPYGESSRLAYESAGAGEVLGERRTDIPVLTTLLTGARHVISLPFWVSEAHVLAVLVAMVFWTIGTLLLANAWWRRS